MSAVTERLSTALAARYRIVDRLGEGGMATVYLAEDLKHDRHVAVKLLRPELAAVLGADRFVQEIKTTAGLQHPHILPLFDSGEADGFLYYVMPYIEGETLRDRLNRDTQLGIEEAVRIATEVADALDYAHRRNVIHRDIKPENILLHDGRAMVADFGIALAVSAAAGGRMTETGLSLGTPHYMSPEQATADKDITNRSDIYSLGAMLYEMLAGDPPHTGSSAQQVIMKIVTEEAALVTGLRKSVPPHIAAAVARSLQKLPADRFEAASAFAGAMADPSFALPAGAGPASPAPPSTWRQRVAVPALTAAGLLLAISIWALTRRPPPEPVSQYLVAFPDDQPVNEYLAWSRMAVSPDGSRLAYLGPGARIFVRERDQLAATELPGTEDAFNPFFSPDGSQVGFMSGVAGIAELRAASLGGGPPITITDSSVGGPGATWGYDGFIYYDDSGVGPLRRVPETGGPSEVVSTLDSAAGELQHAWPDALPNGRGILMVVNRGGPGQNATDADDIAVLDLTTGEHRLLLRGVFARYARSGHILYVTVDGILMAVAFDQDRMEVTGRPVAITRGIGIRGGGGGTDLTISATGTLWYATGTSTGVDREIVWVTRDGQAAEVDPGWVGDFRDLAIAPDGSRLAVSQIDDAGRHVWVKQLGQARGPYSKLTFDDTNLTPQWHPDGREVGFVARGLGGNELRTARADGSGLPAALELGDHLIEYAVWSPDGQWIVYQTTPPRNIYRIRATGDAPAEPLVVSGFVDRLPAVSPNGQWLAYVSNRTGAFEVYVRPFASGDGWLRQISSGWGWYPQWAHDGGALFFANGNDELVEVQILAGDPFTAGEHRALFSLRGMIDWDLTPDDERFIAIRERGTDEPGGVVVVENFFDVLRERVGR